MNGYQLKAEFETRTGLTWPLNIGQAYTTLQRLQRDELVRSLGYRDSETFELTSTGKEAVERWWDSPVERSRPARDELAIKLTLAVAIPGVDVGAVVQRQRTESMRVLHQYTRLKASGDRAEPNDLSWRLLLDSLIFQTEAEIRWLDHVEATVLHHKRSAPHPSPTSGSTPSAVDQAGVS